MYCLRCKSTTKGIYSRGLCNGCYQYIRQKVKGGTLNWDKLVENGWALERGAQGRPTTIDDELMLTSKNEKPEDPKSTLPDIACSQCEFTTSDGAASFAHRKETGHLMKRAVVVANALMSELETMKEMLAETEIEKVEPVSLPTGN